MLQGLIAKKLIGVVLKKVAEKHRINKLQKYVEQDNELDKQMRVVQKTISKQGKYIEELEKEVAILNRDSHPPIFGEKDKKNIIKRIKKLEKEK